MMTRILLIEDDADIREGVRLLLSAEGYEIIEADCGAKGLEQLDESIDLVILDVMMPGISGIKTCEEIRKVSYVPVLFLTAKSSETDKVMGLMAGGDDQAVFLRGAAGTCQSAAAPIPCVQRQKNRRGDCGRANDYSSR